MTKPQSDDETQEDLDEDNYSRELYNADPNCEHDVQAQWSGVKCTKCPGWFCY